MGDLQKTRAGNNAIKLTSSKVITMMIGLASSMLLARFRTLTEYGTYSQLLMAINLVSSLFMLGLPNSINYFLSKAKTDEERESFLSVYYTLTTILSLTVGLVMVLSIPLLEIYFKNDLIKSFWYFLAIYPWTRVIMAGVENLLVVYNKTNILMLYRLLNSVALLAAILVIHVCGGSFNDYMLCFLAVEIVFTAWTYLLAKQNANKLKVSLDVSLIKSIFVFSVPIGFASMIGTVNIELDKMVINNFLSTEDLAIYTNASKELPVSIIASSLTAVLMPQVVKLLCDNKKREAVDLWKSATTISFAIISFIAVACFVFAPEVITILYSEKYLGGTSVFRVYTIVLLFRCTYWGMMLNATGDTKMILYSSIGTLGLNFSLNYLFYNLFGFIGPAIATLISTLTMTVYQLVHTCKKIETKLLQVGPWKNCFIYLMLNIILGVAMHIVKAFIEKRFAINNVVLAILLGLLWFIIYGIICLKPLKKQWQILNKER